ncbi:MAG: LuxR C-terminal-related transcriptional regulator [Brevinematales bacterium]
MEKKILILFFLLGFSAGYGFQTEIYLLEKTEEKEQITYIRGIPSYHLSGGFFFAGWFKKDQWVRIVIQGLEREEFYVLSSGNPWVRMEKIFFYDTNNLPVLIEKIAEKDSFFLPAGLSSVVLDVKLTGTPLVVSPQVMEAQTFFVRKLLVLTHRWVMVVLFCLFLGWYGVWAFRKRDAQSLWKAINFLFLGILTALTLFPAGFNLSIILIMMAVFGFSWVGYQLFMHEELRRPDMIILHGLFLVLLGSMFIAAVVWPLIGFFLFGIAIHFNLILLIFYYQISRKWYFLPWHLFFLLAWMAFFWEMVGLWTRFSPLSPWMIVFGLLAYLLVECWKMFQEIYLDKSLYQFYQNTNRLLKGYLAQSNRKLQETVFALKKESQQKAQLAHLYEIQQRKYRDLVENLSDWIWEMDEHLVITYTSPRIGDFTGISPEKLVKKSLEVVIGKEAFFILKRVIQQQGGKLTGHLLSLQGKDRQILLEVVATPLMKEGKIEGYRCIGRDVSQLITMRSDLSTYQQDFSLLFDHSPLGVAIVDMENMVFYRYNKRFEEIFPLNNARFGAFLEKIGDPYAKDIYFTFKHSLSSENVSFFSFSLPSSLRRNDCWLVVQGHKLFFNNHGYLIITVFPPEFRLFEKQWEWIASWPIPVLLVDKWGKIVLSNEQAKEMFFSFSLPSPLPEGVISMPYGENGTVVIVPRPPLLYLVFGWTQNHGSKQVARNLLQRFPVPWVVLNRDLQVVEWHPSIFEMFHFGVSHVSVLSQMIRESGIGKQISFSSQPFHSVVSAYFRNKQEEVFHNDVYLFVFEEYAMLFFFEVGFAAPEKDMIPLFVHQISLFVESLKTIEKDFLQMEANVSVVDVSHSQKTRADELSLLTETERKILSFLVQGRTNAEIAQLQNISEETVKGHIKHIFKKLGVSKRYQIIQRYHGLV